MQENEWFAFLCGSIRWFNLRRIEIVDTCALVPQSDFLSVAKPADEPLQSVPQTHSPPVVEPVSGHVEVASPPTVTRSGRNVKPPARFQEFTT